MLPTIVVNDESRLIKRFRQVVKRFYVFLLLLVSKNIIDPPALIDRYPNNDGGMVVVLLDYILPLLREAMDVQAVEGMSVGHLTPHDQAQLVSPIEPPRVLYLLMLSNPVQPEALRHLNVVLHG